MEKPLTYAVVGVGAVGGLYGGRLARAGFPVHFLAHSDFAHIRRHGLRVDSVDGDFRLRKVSVYRRAADMPRCDVVLVTLKATANAALREILPRIASRKGVVIVIQNGLGTEESVARLVRPATVLGGLAFLCCNKIGPGHIRHLDYGRLTLARHAPRERPGGVTPIMERVAADLAASGTPADLRDDLALARWKKLMWNIPFNALTIMLNTDTRTIMGNPASRRLAWELMQEVAAGAAACGRTIPTGFPRRMMRDTDRMTPYQPSMKLDFDHGRPMEVEAIYGAPLRAAAARGCRLPRIETFYRLLTALNPQSP
jgi:2-dehydropantoate 2-reductase